MLRQLTRRGRLQVFLKDKSQSDLNVASLTEILHPEEDLTQKSQKALDGAEVAKILAASKPLGDNMYRMLLQYLHSIGQLWRSNVEIPHPPGSLILPDVALHPSDFKSDGRGFSCHRSHEGNSGIQFKTPADSAMRTGFIEEIWQMPLQNHIHTFFLVRQHKALPQSAHAKAPYSSLQGFQTTIVDARQSNQLCIIEPRHVITHLTVYKRPKGTYGINQEFLVICWALNRGRRS